MKPVLSLLMALAVTLALLPGALAEGEAPAFSVVTPPSYETAAGRRYPVLYLLPQDGFAKDNSGLCELLSKQMAEHAGMDMIIVRPSFQEGDNLLSVMNDVVARVEAEYRTVAEPACRIALGTGTGGYLAYTLLLAEGSPFGAAASIRGDFASEANPWLPVCGSVLEKMEALHAADEKAMDRFYTYMDAPVDDAWTDLPGSTDDLGALMIGYGTGSAFHEFTVRPGAFDEAFAEESVQRVLARMTSRILSGAASGTVRLEKTTLTADDAEAKAICTVTVTDAITRFAEGELPLIISLQLQDPKTGEDLASTGVWQMIPGPGEYTEELTLTNSVKGSSADVKLSATLFDTNIDLGKATLIRAQAPVIDGDFQQIELMGDWYFQYVGAQKVLDVSQLSKADYEAWSVVQPGLGNWEKGYGNISDENVVSGYGPDYFNFFITGSGYYVKNFTVPEDFDAKDLELAIGYVDDRCEVFLNGQRVGATGMDEKGQPTGETTWAVFSYYPIDPALLNIGGENTLVVRAWNDLPFGAGGWYGGPIGLYSRTAFDSQYGEAASERFFEESFFSACAARAAGAEGTVENKYLIYLPESYSTSERHYPTVYLLHQFNSDHTSYRTDHVDALLDEGVKAGLFDEMIVVIPNSSEESWWRGDWEKMITDELVPLIDSKYRTIQDARFRLTVGCSMGGQGAAAVALRNPDIFTGMVSFFGAFSYGGESSPNAIAAAEPAEYLKNYALYFICGNQDSYGFGRPAIQLHQQLDKLGVEHGFFIENGGHDSAFYVPFFQQGLAYARSRMYKTDEQLDGLFTGMLSMQGDTLKAELTADPAISNYQYTAPASSYTKLGTQPLNAVLTVRFMQNGETTAILSGNSGLTAENNTLTLDQKVAEVLDVNQNWSATLEAAVLDRVIPLATLEVSVK